MHKLLNKHIRQLLISTVILSTVLILAFIYTLTVQNAEEKYYSLSLSATGCENYCDSYAFISEDGSILKQKGELDFAFISKQIHRQKISQLHITDPFSNHCRFYYITSTADNTYQVFSDSALSAFTVFRFAIGIMLMFFVFIWMASEKISAAITKKLTAPFQMIAAGKMEDTENLYEEVRPYFEMTMNQTSELEKKTEDFRSQKYRLKTIVSNVNEGLILLDPKDNILLINHYAERVFGAQANEVLYKPFLSGLQKPQFIDHLKAVKEGKNADCVYICDDITYQMFFTPVLESQRISGTAIFILDISDKFQTEQLRKEFSANVSHELKTPLTTIYGYAQLISNGMVQSSDIQNFGQKIEKESARLIHLINDIISLSNLEENNEIADKESIDLYTLTSEVAEALHDAAEKRGIAISYSGITTNVFANYHQVFDLIYNLVDNAIKYNRENGSIDIVVSEKQVQVRDTGIGIPADCINRLFERFFRVDKSHSKKVNGTGLGLSIAKHIAQKNNADISVTSEIDKGSTFTVTFSEKNTKNNP